MENLKKENIMQKNGMLYNIYMVYFKEEKQEKGVQNLEN